MYLAKKITRTRFYQALFWTVVAFYCLVFGSHSFENWDSGFVNAFSWRVLQGEAPYRDFLYIRPPVSVYWHALWLWVAPETGQIYTIRILGYLIFALINIWTVSGLDKLYGFQKSGINKWALILVGFLVSAHNFFPDPWFTVDGLFFASAAFYLYAKKQQPQFWLRGLIAILCLLSAFTKQSFYFVPLLFAGWMFFAENWRKALIFCGFLLTLVALYFFWISKITTLDTYFAQTAGVANKSYLIDVGFNNYLHCYHSKPVFASVFLVPLGITYFLAKKITLADYLKWLSVTIFVSALIALPFLQPKATLTIFFNAVAIALAYKTWQYKDSRFLPMAVLLAIGWCASLSLGYRSPILFSGALLAVFFMLMREETLGFRIHQFWAIMAVAVSVFFMAQNAWPYRSAPLWQQTEPLAVVSPKLMGIQTDPATLQKCLELKNLAKKYPNFVTVPSFPLSHYLLGQQNPLPGVWFTDFELNGQTDRFLALAKEKKVTILLETSFLEGETFIENNADRRKFSPLALEIARALKPRERTPHFLVHDAVELPNTLRK